MNWRTLEYALAVHETGSFRAAAQRCHASTPTVSLQIRKLEGYLRLPLFERDSHGARTTARGERIMLDIRRAVLALRAMRRDASVLAFEDFK